ncbi:MAG: LapA family protein [Proteobacteria bacterium]|nr:LapA family protein [Pseudomonadota bacterium]
MNIVRWIIGVVIFLAALLFSFANAEQATLHFFGFGSWQAPLIFVVFCAFALGVTCGLLAGAFRTARLNRELKKARKALLAYEKETEQTVDATAPPPPASSD